MAPRFDIGDFVWAKMKGYPYWPAQIVFPQTPKRKKDTHFIYFYGTRNYAWIAEKNLCHHTNEMLNEARSKKKPKDLPKAICEFLKEVEEPLAPETEEQTGDKIDKEMEKENLTEENVVQHQEKIDKEMERENSIDKNVVQHQEISQPGCSGWSSQSSRKLKYDSVKKDKTDQRKYKRQCLDKKSSDAQYTTMSYEEMGASNVFKAIRDDSTEYVDVLQNNEPLKIPTFFFFGKNALPKPQAATDPLTPIIETPCIGKASSDQVKSIEITVEKVCIIGLNIFSSGIIKNLLHSGHGVIVWDTDPEKCEIFVAAGAIRADTPAEAVMCSDVTVVCISEREIRNEVMFGSEGIYEGFSRIGEDKGYIEMSVTNKHMSKRVENAIVSLGARYNKVHFIPSKEQADTGSLVLSITGDRTLYEDCSSYYKAISKYFFFCEKEDVAYTTITAVNFFIGINYCAAAELTALCEELNVPLKNASNYSEAMNRHGNMYPKVMKSVAEGENSTDIPLKYIFENMDSALETVNKPLHLAKTAVQKFAEAMAMGCEDHDVSAVHMAFK